MITINERSFYNAAFYGYSQRRIRVDAEAHKKDLEVQEKHGVKYLHYWFNEADGTVFCLC